MSQLYEISQRAIPEGHIKSSAGTLLMKTLPAKDGFIATFATENNN